MKGQIERALRYACALGLLCAVGCHPGGEVAAPARRPAPNDQPQAPRGEVVALKPEPAASDEPRVLESFAAGPYTYEVLIERFRPPDDRAVPFIYDPFGVRLLKAERALQQVRVADTSCGIESLRAGGPVRGADSESKTWTTDDDQCVVGTSARTVELSEQVVGLLVTQQRGFEYRYSYQYLYLARGDRLLTLWSHEEDGLGWERTRTSVIAGRAPEQQDIAFIHVERDENFIALKLDATRLHFDLEAVEMRDSPLPDEQSPLYVLVIGDFRNKSAASKVRFDCVEHLNLLKRSLLPGLQTPPLFFGGVFASRKDAAAAVPDPRGCPNVPKSNILEYRSTHRSAHAGDH